MLKTLRCLLLAGCTIAAWTLSSASFSREPNESYVSYGRGVQAYFAGNSSAAEQYLAEAIANNPNDPRPYYFRGLSLLRLGRADEARGEMMMGAMVEARRPDRYQVGRSLERVQGSNRLMLEKIRREARSTNASAEATRRRERYEPSTEVDSEALRQQVAVPLERLVEPSRLPDWTRSSSAVVSQEEAARANQMLDREAANSTVAGSESGDPFADDPQQPMAREPAMDAPFATDTAEQATFEEGESATGEKVPPEKIWGIMGRVLRRAAPVPSLDEIRRNVPLPMGGEPAAESFDGFGGPVEGTPPAMPADDGASFDFGPAASEGNQEFDSDSFGESLEMEEESAEKEFGTSDNGNEDSTGEPLEDNPFGF